MTIGSRFDSSALWIHLPMAIALAQSFLPGFFCLRFALPSEGLFVYGVGMPYTIDRFRAIVYLRAQTTPRICRVTLIPNSSFPLRPRERIILSCRGAISPRIPLERNFVIRLKGFLVNTEYSTNILNSQLGLKVETDSTFIAGLDSG